MTRHLVVAAAWVEAPTPDDATKAVSTALKGAVIPRSGAVVSIAPSEFDNAPGHARLRRDLGQFQLQEAGDFAAASAPRQPAVPDTRKEPRNE